MRRFNFWHFHLFCISQHRKGLPLARGPLRCGAQFGLIGLTPALLLVLVSKFRNLKSAAAKNWFAMKRNGSSFGKFPYLGYVPINATKVVKKKILLCSDCRIFANVYFKQPKVFLFTKLQALRSQEHLNVHDLQVDEL